MERYISKETESKLTKLGLYQVAGGAIGILIIFWGIYNTTSLNALIVLLYACIIIFFSYSIFSGVLCLKTRDNALKHSFINQILQVIGFSISGYAFNYIAGIYLNVKLDLTESIEFGLGLGISTFDLKFNSGPDSIVLNFNIIALLLIIWIDKLIKKVKEESAIRKAAEIGTT